MDTRAWRLALGRHVAWFEIDQQRVLDKKLAVLRGANTQTSHLSDSDTMAEHLSCGEYHAVGARSPHQSDCRTTSAVESTTLSMHVLPTEATAAPPQLWRVPPCFFVSDMGARIEGDGWEKQL